MQNRTASERAFLKIHELMESGIEPSVAIEFVKSDLRSLFDNATDYIDCVEWIIEQLERRRNGSKFDGKDF